MLRGIFIVIVLLLPVTSKAECALDEVVGYTLIAAKKISAKIDNGTKIDGYEGCQYGRILVFTDGTGVTCASYHYQYAYMPTAYIFSSGNTLKACIADEFVDVRPLQ